MHDTDVAVQVDPQSHPEAADGGAALSHLPQRFTIHNPEIHMLYGNYVKSFSQPDASNDQRLKHAKALVVALLEHYYPKSEGFSVDPVSLDPMAKFGWNFWQYPDGYNPREAKGNSKKKNAGGGRPVFYPFAAKYHRIAPQHITGFAVLSSRKNKEGNGTAANKLVPYTYVGIVMDTLDTMDTWVPEELQRGVHLVSNPRIDLLRWSLGHQAEIRRGYGILLLGPRIEFYTYDQDSKNEDEPFSHFAPDVWMVDVREQGLDDLDPLFRQVRAKEVVYK